VSIRSLNLQKRRLRCLRCGRLFWTDRCHRVCKKCTEDAREPFVRPVVTTVGVTLLCDSRLSEEADYGPTETFSEGSTAEVKE